MAIRYSVKLAKPWTLATGLVSRGKQIHQQDASRICYGHSAAFVWLVLSTVAPRSCALDNMASCPHPNAAPSSARMRQSHALRASKQSQQAGRSVAAYAGSPILEVKDLRATVAATGSEVLKGVNLKIEAGQVTAIMGKNGCGKSTLSKVLVGHPDYEVTSGTAMYKGENLLEMEPEERARAGLFLSFQAPIEVPGVNNVDFLRLAANARRKSLGEPELEPLEFYMHVQPKVRLRRSSISCQTRL